MKKIVLILSLILVAIVAFFFFTSSPSENSLNKPEFAKTQRGKMLITLKESGFLNAVEEITIKNEITTKQLNIVKVIPDGSYVKAGDFLIELDSEPLETAKKTIEAKLSERILALNEAQNSFAITQSEVASETSSAKNSITFAQLDLEKFQQLDKTRQLSEALANIDEAKDQLNLSQQSYTNSVELESKGFETANQVERDKLDLAAKQKKLNSFEAKLEILQKYDLIKAESQFVRDLEETKNKYERMVKEGENKIQKAQAKVTNAQVMLDSSKLELDNINEQLAKTILKSGADGYALYPQSRGYGNKPKIEPGQPVFRNQTLMRIPKMNDMKVDIEVAEHFISDLKKDQNVIITIDSLKDQNFTGKVSNIALLPTPSQGWLSSSVQKYTVIIDVDDETLPDNIKPQISASAEIIIDTLEDVLFIPIQAVHTVKGKQIAYVRSGIGSEYEEREVTIGKMETNYIQIIEGLTEGEEVLISEPLN